MAQNGCVCNLVRGGIAPWWLQLLYGSLSLAPSLLVTLLLTTNNPRPDIVRQNIAPAPHMIIQCLFSIYILLSNYLYIWLPDDGISVLHQSYLREQELYLNSLGTLPTNTSHKLTNTLFKKTPLKVMYCFFWPPVN